MKKKYVIAGVPVIALVLLVAMPFVTVQADRQTLVKESNETVAALDAGVKTLGEIGTAATPTGADLKKVVDQEQASVTQIKETIELFGKVYGFRGLDVTGQYEKLSDQTTAVSTSLAKLNGLIEADIARNQSQIDVLDAFNAMSNVQDPTQYVPLGKQLAAATKSYQEFANSDRGTSIDKKLAAAYARFAVASESFGKIANSQDVAALTAASAELEAVSNELTVLEKEAEKADQAFVDQLNATIDELNAATAKL